MARNAFVGMLLMDEMEERNDFAGDGKIQLQSRNKKSKNDSTGT